MIDHLVVTAPSLTCGVEYVRERLGVEMAAGGEHPQMGTHNCVLRLGENCYLEVLAVNPNVAPPAHSRWFHLDRLTPETPPRFTTWVLRTDDMQRCSSLFAGILGTVHSMSRGSHHWELLFPDDGSLPLDGAAPLVIQWHTDPPVNRMPDMGCRLLGLDIHTSHSEALDSLLKQISFSGEVKIHTLTAAERSHLSARIQTPSGIRVLM